MEDEGAGGGEVWKVEGLVQEGKEGRVVLGVLRNGVGVLLEERADGG